MFSWIAMNLCKPSDATPDKEQNCMNSSWFPLISLIMGLCVSAAHDTGLVTLQVAVSNQIISNSVVFEYKARALPSLPSSQHDWLSLDGRSSSVFFCIVGGKKCVTLLNLEPILWPLIIELLEVGDYIMVSWPKAFLIIPHFIKKLKAHLIEIQSMSWRQRKSVC